MGDFENKVVVTVLGKDKKHHSKIFNKEDTFKVFLGAKKNHNNKATMHDLLISEIVE